MPASWADLFDRGADYEADLETVRAASDEVSATETEESVGAAETGETENDDA